MKSRRRGAKKHRPVPALQKKVHLHQIKSQRIQLIDLLRGVALLGMTIVHGAWDLEFFGFLPQGTSDQAFWSLFAASVAGSFLALVGISLHLAHGPDIRWRSWAKRIGIIGISAAGVTAVTATVTPDEFIRFGILHMIVAGSIFGLGVLRWSTWLVIAFAVAVAMISVNAPVGLIEGAVGYVLGFSSDAPPASDYRPIFPWLASVLFGIGGAKLIQVAGWWTVIGRVTFVGRIGRIFCWAGRYSLAYYLIHQPILFAIIWIVKISG